MNVPRIVGVRSSETFRGEDWMGLKLRDASVFVLMFPVLESIEWAQQAQAEPAPTQSETAEPDDIERFGGPFDVVADD